MAEKDDNAQIKPDDLDLVDDRLEDETKDDAALWSEFDQAETGAAASDDDPDAASSFKDDDDDGDDTDAAAGEDGTNSDDGAAEADEQASSDDRSGDDKSSDQRQAPDIWAQATPEQRAAYDDAQAQLKKLEQAERSNRGRLSALQRQINDLTARQQGSQAASPQAAEGEQGQGEQSDFLGTDEWKSFSEEYPEVAGPLGKMIGRLESQITRQEKELSAIGTERRQSAIHEQAELLATDHPDWEQVTADTGFSEWLGAQPRHIQEAAVRNANEIVDAAEAGDVVARFKAFRVEQGGGNAQEKDTSRKDTSNQRAPLSGKRQRQLESASSARARGPGVGHGIPEDGDPEHIWKQFEAMERRAGGT